MANPLDPLELQPFLRNLKEEMPIHTETTAKIKRSYSQGMPKNLMDYSAFVNNHFLNDNLAIIEEMQHRNKSHPIPKWFREYQLRHYAKYGILKGDHFFGPLARIFLDLGKHRAIGFLPFTGMTLGFGTIGDTKVFGSTLETNDGSTASNGSMGAEDLHLNKLPTAIINTWYDQIAQRLSGTTGNLKHAVYTGATPGARLAVTGSIPAYNTYAFQSVTEFQITEADNWVATIDDAGVEYTQYYYKNQTSGDKKMKTSITFAGGPPDPAGTGYTDLAAVFQMKIGHS